jgi:hypothetical protein
LGQAELLVIDEAAAIPVGFIGDEFEVTSIVADCEEYVGTLFGVYVFDY